MYSNVYNALWTPQNRKAIKMKMQKNLKARLIQNIPETELETEFESESGIFLLTISPLQLPQCKNIWDST